MYDLILYDTSNYVDFPIGGQLTSIRNFLRYISLEHKEVCGRILLVGITNESNLVGKIIPVIIENAKFDFLPVLWRDTNLNAVKKSLRLQFLKALFKNGRRISCGKKTIHYLHTPEAFIYCQVMHPFSSKAVFSHGSFFNMVKGFRFFQNNKIIASCFDMFIRILLRQATVVFALDQDSKAAYEACGANVEMVDNSIVLPEGQFVRQCVHSPVRLLFVGRLSRVKRVDTIIRAVSKSVVDCMLTIVGDGEEDDELRRLVQKLHMENKIEFMGSVKPDEVKKYMKQSDILVMNSVLEGKPMTIIEALGYGLPVITTPVGGIPELVSDQLNAVYTKGEETDIAEAVSTICQKYNEYSRNAINASQRYDYRTVNRLIFGKLKEIHEKMS